MKTHTPDTFIPKCLSKIEKELSLLNYGEKPRELYEPIDYMMTLGGKRLRPLLVLLGCDLFGGKVNEAIHPALAIEVFHNFTLVHDDIMDKAPLRRNKPTVCKKWDNNVALLSGDAMLIWAYKLLSQCDRNKFRKIFDVFNETAMYVCEGQQLDMNFEREKQISIEEYVNMIYLKTAALIACSIKTGAILGGGGDKNAWLLYGFGKNTGIAFQLQDDLLDVFGNPEKFGKRNGGDIISNKKTFLFLKALEIAGEKKGKKFVQLYTSRTLSPHQKIKEVTAIYEDLDIKEETAKAISYYFDRAQQKFSQVKADKAKKENLLKLVNGLMKREA